MIRNLFFDLDDTLLDFRQSERAALAETLRHASLPLTDAVCRCYSEINAGYWKRLERHEITRDALKVRRFCDLFEELGIRNADPAAVAADYESRLSRQSFLVTGARETLIRLRQSYRLFAASNGTGAVQRSRLAGAGLADLFESLFLSGELGAEKPSAAFFDACFARFPELKRSETVLIGDSLSSDIAGGHRAGLLTVWFNPSHAENPTAILPDAEIHTLADTETILTELAGRQAHEL